MSRGRAGPRARLPWAAAVGLIGLLLAASGLPAQEPTAVAAIPSGVALEARGGINVPVGDIADFNDRGVVVGGGPHYRISPRWAVGLQFTAELMPGSDWDNVPPVPSDHPVQTGPATDLWHLTAEARVQLTRPAARTGWRLWAHAGAGWTWVRAEPTSVTEGGTFGRLTYNGGLTVRYSLWNGLALIGRGEAFVLDEREDWLLSISDDGPGHLGKELTIPITAGLQLRLP